MSKTRIVRARVDEDVTAEAEAILSQLGLSPSEAIRLFYRQIVLRRALPFTVEMPLPHRSQED